jgi:hypothetical protein
MDSVQCSLSLPRLFRGRPFEAVRFEQCPFFRRGNVIENNLYPVYFDIYNHFPAVEFDVFRFHAVKFF